MRGIAASLGVLLTSAVVAAQTPGFWLVGRAPGTQSSLVTSLTSDGGTAAGGSAGIGFTWTRENGRYDYGLEPGMPAVTATYGISSDGGILAGAMLPTNSSRAFRRVGSGPLVDLGLLPGFTRAYSRGMSGDGGTVVGTCEWGQSSGVNGQAFRWTEQGGMQGLGYVRPGGEFSQALAISRDGTTIVGESQTNLHSEAFVWRDGAGMQALPRIPGSPPAEWSRASDVNADGTVIVGYDTTPLTNQAIAVRWSAGGVQPLGTVSGYLRSYATAVDGSGTIVAGVLNTGLPATAFVWTPQSGMQVVSDYLSGNGVRVPAGYRVINVSVISGDGLTFGGWMISTTSNTVEGFVATVPGPGAGVVVLVGVVMGWRRRRG